MHLRPSKSIALLLTLALAPSLRSVSHAEASAGGPSFDLVNHVKHAVVIVYSFDARGRLLSQGSGFLTRANRVVTNLHVVGHASRVEVVTFGGQTHAAEGVVCMDGSRDLAALELKRPLEGVTPLEVSEERPRAGEEVFVVSNPRGSLWEVSRGRTLAQRFFPELGPLVPFTAIVSRGSSGGPVVNLRGQVIGIATMGLRTHEDQYFAVPGYTVARLRTRPLMPFPLRSGD